MTRKTSATPAGVPRSRSCFTRRERKQIEANVLEIQAMQRAYEDCYGPCNEDDPDFYDPDCGEFCARCGGEGFIEYMDAPDTWVEDCPSEENHLVTCPDCGGQG